MGGLFMNNSSLNNISNKPIKTESLADKVYDIIENNIINMTLKPGSTLSEDEVAKALDISRSPVREALLKLEHVGLVKKKRNGRIVAKITKKEIIDNYEIWEMVESFAGTLACKNTKTSDLKIIGNILHKMEMLESEDYIDEYRELNNQFHLSLVKPCPNKHLKKMHKDALNKIHWCYNYSISWSSDITSSSIYHHKIFDSYQNKKCELLNNLIAKHIRDACSRFQKEYT